MSRVVLDVREVEKQFGTVKAVDRLSFHVRRGEVFALLGPNGSGKTTTLRMLLDIIRPDCGSIAFSLSGNGPSRPAPAELGYLPEDRGLYRDTPVLRTLVYFGILRGMTRRTAGAAAMRWLERFGLRDRAAERVDALSKGNQQKVQFVASVLHGPALAVLDEPFSGLDPVNQELFLEVLHELRAAGTTLIFSAHQMPLVERAADRILLVSRGREVLSGTLDEIRERAATAERVVVAVNGEPSLEALRAHAAVASAVVSAPGEVTLVARDGASLGELLAAAVSHLDVVAVRSEHQSLHDIYVAAVGQEGGGRV